MPTTILCTPSDFQNSWQPCIELTFCRNMEQNTIAAQLRAALRNFLLHQNSRLFTVTFGEELVTFAKNQGS